MKIEQAASLYPEHQMKMAAEEVRVFRARIEALEVLLREARQYVSDAEIDEDSETQRNAKSLLIKIDDAFDKDGKS